MVKDWDYRVLEFESSPDDDCPEGTQWRAIHEVHYDGAGRPVFFREEAVTVAWDTYEGDAAPYRTLELMVEALSQPVLRSEDFVAPHLSA